MLFNALLSIARAAVKAPNAGRFGALVGVLRPLAESSGSGSGLPSDHPALVLAALARELLLLDAASGPALVENDIDDIISLLSPVVPDLVHALRHQLLLLTNLGHRAEDTSKPFNEEMAPSACAYIARYVVVLGAVARQLPHLRGLISETICVRSLEVGEVLSSLDAAGGVAYILALRTLLLRECLVGVMQHLDLAGLIRHCLQPSDTCVAMAPTVEGEADDETAASVMRDGLRYQCINLMLDSFGSIPDSTRFYLLTEAFGDKLSKLIVSDDLNNSRFDMVGSALPSNVVADGAAIDKFCASGILESDNNESLSIDADPASAVAGVCGIRVPVVSMCSDNDGSLIRRKIESNVVATPSTLYNMRKIVIGVSSASPVILVGENGSGKSFLIRELAEILGQKKNLVELHLDDSVDSKTLIGSYVCSDIPGEFNWKAGLITQAVTKGHWLVIEDIDSAPSEVVASLSSLIEKRRLYLPSIMQEVQAHPNFRIFGTIGKIKSAQDMSVSVRHDCEQIGKAAVESLHLRRFSRHWLVVSMRPMPLDELRSVVITKFPKISAAVVNRIIATFQTIRDETNIPAKSVESFASSAISHFIRSAISIRDVMKIVRRVNDRTEGSNEYITEGRRSEIVMEILELALSRIRDIQLENQSAVSTILYEYIVSAVAHSWDVTRDSIDHLWRHSIPQISLDSVGTGSILMLGRVSFPVNPSSPTLKGQNGKGLFRDLSTFAFTRHSLRILERIAAAVTADEPILLVGETGTGKTTSVQELAQCIGKKLIVQNISLSTDVNDLFGGFKPVTIKQMLSPTYENFLGLFQETFSHSQNGAYLQAVAAYFRKENWRKMLQAFKKASNDAIRKLDDSSDIDTALARSRWSSLLETSIRFESNLHKIENGFAFSFTEGLLVDAMRKGHWILLDEINLASPETLQGLVGILDGQSLCLTERGDVEPVDRHKDFRIFAAMNPPNDVGKRELIASLRSRFSEIYVDEMTDENDLAQVVSRSLGDAGQNSDGLVRTVVDIYLSCRKLSAQSLVDSAGTKPRYSLRTLTRTLKSALSFLSIGIRPLNRALYEAFVLNFVTCLNEEGRSIVLNLLQNSLSLSADKNLNMPPPRPGGKSSKAESWSLVAPFWLRAGPIPPVDWSEHAVGGAKKFVLTTSVESNIRTVAASVAANVAPILLQGPTSVGKTTMIEYLAARAGFECIRINNHEHTDVQEYIGSYVANTQGRLEFQDGLLVQALRRGCWIILDELNLAPSDVLEALNRLLDDNQELFISETGETVKPAPGFTLFATQNPPGVYGGRKPLSRAFKNRFIEIHVDDMPFSEIEEIVFQVCGVPRKISAMLVSVLKEVQIHRQESNLFQGKHGAITTRDLIKWGKRKPENAEWVALTGYILLAEKLRIKGDIEIICQILESCCKVKFDFDTLYKRAHLFPDMSAEDRKYSARLRLKDHVTPEYPFDNDLQALDSIREQISGHSVAVRGVVGIAPTKTMQRMWVLVKKCLEFSENVLLVGETGCGKTTVCQLLAALRGQRLRIVNCHQSTETSDIIGGLRPIRNREAILTQLNKELVAFHHMITELPVSSGMNLSTAALRDLSECNSSVPAPIETIRRSLDEMNAIVIQLRDSLSSSESAPKKAKFEDLGNATLPNVFSHVEQVVQPLWKKYNSLFEWQDGPLVEAMRNGDIFLLDEINLAEDAVIERLNSVLESGKTLTLVEKGTSENNDSIVAHPNFRFLATMNPGGDFGKRELSPALRSRFTELWIPAVQDRLDLVMIIKELMVHVLNESLVGQISEAIVQFTEWIELNSKLLHINNLKLSVREVLAWVQFIVDWNSKAKTIESDNVYLSFVHGAHVLFLDGLGLGMGSVSRDVIKKFKKLAIDFILTLCPQDIQDKIKDSISIELAHIAGSGSWPRDELIPPSNVRKILSIGPFSAACAPEYEQVPESRFGSSYVLKARSTLLNLFRVLRALQLPRPILLEGPPGVGKTSLISTLAKITGHKLVRINLSEHSEISDLLGTDLPAVDIGEGESTSAPQFKWVDGVFLSALKNGDWVLLDELNLAPQSVLEGLNACFDHRGEVFLPEIGQSFKCPPTFRVFCAQNPVGEGGGRKGLPQSFLSRFSRVFVEAMTMDDLVMIAKDSLEFNPMTKAYLEECIPRMVLFVHNVQRDTSDSLSAAPFGRSGSPWEFNLRDTLRWLEVFAYYDRLIASLDGDTEKVALLHKYILKRSANLLFAARMRTDEDKVALGKLFEEALGLTLRIERDAPVAAISSPMQSKSFFVCGWAKIPMCPLMRSTLVSLPFRSSELSSIEYSVMHGDMKISLENVAFCIEQNWPVLLVGASGSGKKKLVRYLAEQTGNHLVEFPMTAAIDSSDLLGSFEQVNVNRACHNALRASEEIVLFICSKAVGCTDHNYVAALAKCCAILRQIKNLSSAIISADALRLDSGQIVLRLFDSLVSDLFEIVSLKSNIDEYESQLLSEVRCAVESLAALATATNLSGFQWVDGILIDAMRKGFWLLFDNANLCSPSVLDRLNSLLEPNGTILLTESGDGQYLKPHPNFRIFFSMDPNGGEVSRAMRNRCVECFVAGRQDYDLLLKVVHNSTSRTPMSRAILEGMIKTQFSAGIKPSKANITLAYCKNYVKCLRIINSNYCCSRSELDGALILLDLLGPYVGLKTAVAPLRENASPFNYSTPGSRISFGRLTHVALCSRIVGLLELVDSISALGLSEIHDSPDWKLLSLLVSQSAQHFLQTAVVGSKDLASHLEKLAFSRLPIEGVDETTLSSYLAIALTLIVRLSVVLPRSQLALTVEYLKVIFSKNGTSSSEIFVWILSILSSISVSHSSLEAEKAPYLTVPVALDFPFVRTSICSCRDSIAALFPISCVSIDSNMFDRVKVFYSLFCMPFFDELDYAVFRIIDVADESSQIERVKNVVLINDALSTWSIFQVGYAMSSGILSASESKELQVVFSAYSVCSEVESILVDVWRTLLGFDVSELSPELFQAVRSVMDARDFLSRTMRTSPRIVVRNKMVLPFDYLSILLIWITKSLESFSRVLTSLSLFEIVNRVSFASSNVRKCLNYIEICFGRSGGVIRKNRLWKIGGHVEVPVLAKDWRCLYTIRECMALLSPPQGVDFSSSDMRSYYLFRRDQTQLVEDCVGFNSTFYLLKTRESSWIGSAGNKRTLSGETLDVVSVANELLRRCQSSSVERNIVDYAPDEEMNELVEMELFAQKVKMLIGKQDVECGYIISVQLAEIFVVRQLGRLCEIISSVVIDLDLYLKAVAIEQSLGIIKNGFKSINSITASVLFAAIHFSLLNPSEFRELRTLSWCASAVLEEYASRAIPRSICVELRAMLKTAIVSLETRTSRIFMQKYTIAGAASWVDSELENVLATKVLKAATHAPEDTTSIPRIRAIFYPLQLFVSWSIVDSRALASKGKATQALFTAPDSSDIPIGMSSVIKKKFFESFRLLTLLNCSAEGYKPMIDVESAKKMKLYLVDTLVCFLDYFNESRLELGNLVEVLHGALHSGVRDNIASFYSSLESLDKTFSELSSAVHESDYVNLRSLLWTEYLHPVLHFIAKSRSAGDSFDVVDTGLMWLRLGCLRAQLCLPSLPIDPSTKYSVKADILSKHYERLCSILTLSYSANCLGSINDVSAEMKNLYSACKLLQNKIKSLNARAIERPFDVCAENNRELEAFVDVFEKLQIGCQNLANPVIISATINKMQSIIECCKSSKGLSSSMIEEVKHLISECENWQESLSAFQSAIYDTIPEYEDVYSPLFSSLQNMYFGISCAITFLSDASQKFRTASRAVSLSSHDANYLIRSAIEYPFTRSNQSSSAEHLLRDLLLHNDILTRPSNPSGPSSVEAIGARRQFLCIFQLILKRMEYFVDSESIKFPNASLLLRSAIELLLGNFKRSEDERKKAEAEKASLFRTKETSYISNEADEEELSLRQHFPDHLRELGFISKASEMDGSEAMEQEDVVANSPISSDNFHITLDFGSVAIDVIGQELRMFMRYLPNVCNGEQLSSRHYQSKAQISYSIFAWSLSHRLGLMRDLVDQSLLVAKQYSSQIANTAGDSIDSALMGVSCLAFSVMASECDTPASLIRYDISKFGCIDKDLMYLLFNGTSNYAKPLNFHADRFGSELIACAEPLKLLVNKCTDLLTQFPGNDILLHICTLAVKLSNYHISTPLGKMLASLELLYRNAYEWESYAAKHVSMSDEISRLGSVIGKWRTLELRSWDHLLRVKEEEYVRKAANNWFPLTSAILEFWSPAVEPAEFQTNSSRFDFHDSYIPEWMNRNRQGKNIAPPDLNLTKLFETLDLFLKSCTVGEFPSRLHLVRLCALRLFHSSLCSARSYNSTAFFVVLNIWKFYDQFLPSVRKFQEILKSPIQKRISDEIKISKWDQLSSYGLVEHSERIHRKLNKIIRQYQSDVLDYPVSSLLQRETIGGIVDKAGESVIASQIPDLKQLFPYVAVSESESLKVDVPDIESGDEADHDVEKAAEVALDAKVKKSFGTEKQIAPLEATDGDVKNAEFVFESTLDQVHNIWPILALSAEVSESITASGALRLLKIGELSKKAFRHLHFLFSSTGPCRLGLEVHGQLEDLCDSIFHRVQSLRPADVPRNAKYKALKDMFDGLESEVGISHLLSDSPEELRSPYFVCSLPSPLFSETLLDVSWNFASPRDLSERGENYYLKSVSEISEMRTQASCAASPDVGSREVALMLALTENLFYKSSHSRAKLCGHIEDLKQLGRLLLKLQVISNAFEGSDDLSNIPIKVVDSLGSIWAEMQSEVNRLINATNELEVLVQAAVESMQATETDVRLNQFATLLGSSDSRMSSGALSELRAVKANLEACLIPHPISGEDPSVTYDSSICSQLSSLILNGTRQKTASLVSIKNMEEIATTVARANSKIKDIMSDLSSTIPSTVSTQVLEVFADSLKRVSLSSQKLRTHELPRQAVGFENALLGNLGEVFEMNLIRIQLLKGCSEGFNDEGLSSPKTITEKLEQAHKCISTVGIKEMFAKLSQFYTFLLDSSMEASVSSSLAILRRVMPSTMSLYLASVSIVDDLIKSQKSMCKLTYVSARIFRTIIAKGFCGAKVNEQEGNGNGDAENMTFEDDVEGTGMGEGDGKKDVSDQIQNEEQLLGLKSDESKPPSDEAQQPDKKLSKEDKDKGVEMTQDFDGDMFDVPSSDESSNDKDSDNEDDDEEDLDREMEDDGQIDQKNVVDEKMWGSDDEVDDSKDEKFEDNTKSKGDTLDGEMTTKENDDDKEKDDENTDNADTDKEEAKSSDKNKGEDEEHGETINEDNEDKHVERPLGVDLRESDNEESADESDDNREKDGDETTDKMEEVDDHDGEQPDDTAAPELDSSAPMNENDEPAEDLPADMDLNDMESIGSGGDDKSDINDDQSNNEGDVMDVDENCTDESPPNQAEEDNLVKGGLENESVEIGDKSKRHQKSSNASAFGIKSSGGQDSIQAAESGQDEDRRDRKQQDAQGTEGDGEGSGGSSDNNTAQSAAEKEEKTANGDDDGGGANSGNDKGSADGAKSRENSMNARNREAPNPFRKKGDLSKAWFERLDMKRSNASSGSQRNQESQSQGGMFEFELNSASNDPTNDAGGDQVLAETVDGDAAQLPEQGTEDQNPSNGSGAEKTSQETARSESSPESNTADSSDPSAPSGLKRNREELSVDGVDESEDVGDAQNAPDSDDRSKKKSKVGDDKANDGDGAVAVDDALDDDSSRGNPAMEIEDDAEDNKSEEPENSNGNKFGGKSFSGKIDNRTDLLKKKVDIKLDSDNIDEESFQLIDASQQQSVALSDGTDLWAKHKALAEESSASLCEQLRLILEPNLTARLRGDYRTGKRINMRKVISYVASGFRRDKIWLRRTKLAKRSYQVMLMIDDTYSMGAAGSLALTSLAIISGALTRLEVGELCVASFSDRVNILHPFGSPFSDQSGSKIASSITFKASKTLLADALQSVIPVFEDARSTFGGRTSGDSKTTVQLCFLISDARLDTDNRARLQAVVRDMAEKHIMVVLIIIDHNVNSKDSIFNTKSIEFTDEGIVTRPYLQDFPFPFYVAIQKLSALPVVLADSLRQWFEFVQHSIEDA